MLGFAVLIAGCWSAQPPPSQNELTPESFQMPLTYGTTTVNYEADKPITADLLKHEVLERCATATIAAGYQCFQVTQYSAQQQNGRSSAMATITMREESGKGYACPRNCYDARTVLSAATSP